MAFSVVAERFHGNDREDGHGGRVGPPRWWKDGRAHLVIKGSDVTLCAVPADQFLPVDGVDPDADDVEWCLLCHLTART